MMKRTAPVPELPRAAPYTLAGVLVVLAAVTLAFTVRLVIVDRQVGADENRRQVVLQAARQQALNFTTIGYKTVDHDIDRVIAGATGDFKASYQQNRDTIKETVTKNRSTSKGEVLDSGLVSIDADSAVALVVADASVTNVAYKKPTLRNYRMRLDLAKVGNRWLVSDIEFVS
jgi:Mce-associated membrane protein